MKGVELVGDEVFPIIFNEKSCRCNGKQII
jgi:hypothetical protein